MNDPIVSVEFLETNGFTLTQYPDGLFWVRRAHEELLLQLNESRTRATLYDNGWVEDYLTVEEVQSTINQFNDKY
jgi:hypothetical protein